jgi:hypothetical protein
MDAPEILKELKHLNHRLSREFDSLAWFIIAVQAISVMLSVISFFIIEHYV